MNPEKQVLVIVESPTKSRTIARFLKDGYKVMSSKGHIRDLDDKTLSIDVDKGFECKYKVVEGKSSLIKELKQELSKSSELLLATDEDREGEAISWHLLQVLKPKVPYRRMVFHEITKSAIMKALEQGRPLDENLVRAQEGRRVVDRLYGYTLSPMLWSMLSNKKLSAGRVQSVGLRLNVERCRQRILFESHRIYDAVASLETVEEKPYQARLVRYQGKSLAQSRDFDSVTGKFKGNDVLCFDSADQVESIIGELSGQDFRVLNLEEKPFITNPSIPFTTSTLQQDAIRKLRMSASQVMSTAQRLYENGYITYMRTDSPSLSKEGTFAARDEVKRLYGEDYLSDSPRFFKAARQAQEAHEAIRPAGNSFVHPDDTPLTGKEKALYALIWRRTLACQMVPAKKATTTVTLAAGDAEFQTSGTRILFPGFLKVYNIVGDEKSDDARSESLLPGMKEGEIHKLVSLKSDEHKNKPPARYTEASLVKELEKRGIGRPSTYATILKTLMDRNYVQKSKNGLVLTFTGYVVCQYLEDHFSELIDYDFTSEMEEDLDLIAEGDTRLLDFLNSFYGGLSRLEESASASKSADDKKMAKTIRLPQLSDERAIHFGPFGCYVINPDAKDKKGKFISIPESWYPESVTDSDVDALIRQGSAHAAPQEIAEDLFLKEGRYGFYWEKGDKRASVPSFLDEEQRQSEEYANRYLSLPRILGKDSEGREVFANVGRFGPYVGCDGEFRNLNRRDHHAQLFSVTLEQALSLLAEPKGKAKKRGAAKAGANVVMTLGEFEDQPVQLCTGRYGFYVKHKKKNYPIPSEYKKDEEKAKSLTLAQAVEAIREKRQKV